MLLHRPFAGCRTRRDRARLRVSVAGIDSRATRIDDRHRVGLDRSIARERPGNVRVRLDDDGHRRRRDPRCEAVERRR